MRRASLSLACCAMWLASLCVTGAESARAQTTVEHLVPEMQGRSFALEPGPRPYRDRLGFSPGFGRLGGEDYYTVRMSFHPLRWLGWEAHLGHNPSQSVHALVNGLNVQLRWPLAMRVQPYGTLGFGMMMIFPGRVFEADPVTRNQLTAGAGLEFFLRDDVALRGELRGATLVGGSDASGIDGGFRYREYTFGLTFYRTIQP